MEIAVASAVGGVVGVVLGLLGAGGSLLTVPALVFLLGLDTGDASGTSLVAVAMMATTGLVVHARAGRCACREGATFGIAAAVVAAGAGALAALIPDPVLSGAFAVLLVVTAVWITRRDGGTSMEASSGDASVLTIGVAGGGVGALTGLLGVGGGFLIVPALIGLRDMPMPLAVGTSQLIVVISALAGIVGRVAGGSIHWRLGLLFGLGGIVGAAVGSKLADRVSPRRLRLGFAGVAGVVAVAMAWQALAPTFAG